MTSYLGKPSTRVVPRKDLPSAAGIACWALFLALAAPQVQAFSWGPLPAWRAAVRSWQAPRVKVWNATLPRQKPVPVRRR